MISIVINLDTRPGMDQEVSTVGDFGGGSLQGCRSWDYLTHGVRNKVNYFRGQDIQLVVAIDEHLPLPEEIRSELNGIVESVGNGSIMVCGPHDRIRHRWYDYITLDALRLAKGDFWVHFDSDANAFRSDDSTIIDDYLQWIDSSDYQFVCQPSSLTPEEHQMYWASTRFFIGRAMDVDYLEKCLDNTFLAGQRDRVLSSYIPYPCCLEHTLGVLAGTGRVLYPPIQDDYIVFSWVRYRTGVLPHLNSLPYHEARKLLDEWGMCGPNDVICP